MKVKAFSKNYTINPMTFQLYYLKFLSNFKGESVEFSLNLCLLYSEKNNWEFIVQKAMCVCSLATIP